MTLVKTIRKNFFKIIAIWVLQKEREIRLNSEYKKGKWGFIAKEQGEGSIDG